MAKKELPENLTKESTDKRVLQVNLDGTGGAFSLLFRIQKILYPDIKFDYYWMGDFYVGNNQLTFDELDTHIFEEGLRKNRLIGHIVLPFRFYTFLKKHKYCVIHIHSDLSYKHFLYALPAKLAGVSNIIVHSHSSGVNGDHQGIKKALHKLCRPLLSKVGTIFLTCSEKASMWMFDSKCSEKTVLIKNGVELDKFSFNEDLRKKYRRKLNVDNKIVLGTVGNLSYQKYPEFLLKILACLDERYIVLFVGDGPNRTNIENYALRNHLSDRVIFYGATNKVNEILNAFDIFIMTSRFEGLPVSAVEAQANGLPCILSDKITRETAILSDCIFCSIDESVKTWVNAVLNIHNNINRNEATEILRDAGFDINESAKKLKRIYSIALNEGKKCI